MTQIEKIIVFLCCPFTDLLDQRGIPTYNNRLLGGDIYDES